jgi:hypothetical protein
MKWDADQDAFDVCYVLNSGAKADLAGGPSRARRRHRPPSFNDLVGAAEQGKWHGEAKRLCRLHVDYEFELCDLLHR